jgi:precorrin-3B synthase
MAIGLAFGRAEAAALTELFVRNGRTKAVRVTPWRVLLTEGPNHVTVSDGLLADPADRLLQVEACPGMPCCPQASVETRDLARRLAPMVVGRLHVSGCAKGCACQFAADVTLTGRDGLYDISLNGLADSSPVRSALSRPQVLAHFGVA